MKILWRWTITLLIALIGLGVFTSGIGYANPDSGEIIIPEIKKDFKQFDPAPKSPEGKPINENAQVQAEESGKWDWLTKPVKKGWQWLKDTGSKLGNGQKKQHLPYGNMSLSRFGP